MRNMFLNIIFSDIYEDKLDELNLETQATFALLVKKLKDEQELIVSLIELQGILKTVLSASETTKIPIIKHSYNFSPSITAQQNLVFKIS